MRRSLLLAFIALSLFEILHFLFEKGHLTQWDLNSGLSRNVTYIGRFHSDEHEPTQTIISKWLGKEIEAPHWRTVAIRRIDDRSLISWKYSRIHMNLSESDRILDKSGKREYARLVLDALKNGYELGQLIDSTEAMHLALLEFFDESEGFAPLNSAAVIEAWKAAGTPNKRAQTDLPPHRS